jgi:hypothetical protein
MIYIYIYDIYDIYMYIYLYTFIHIILTRISANSVYYFKCRFSILFYLFI